MQNVQNLELPCHVCKKHNIIRFERSIWKPTEVLGKCATCAALKAEPWEFFRSLWPKGYVPVQSEIVFAQDTSLYVPATKTYILVFEVAKDAHQESVVSKLRRTLNGTDVLWID